MIFQLIIYFICIYQQCSERASLCRNDRFGLEVVDLRFCQNQEIIIAKKIKFLEVVNKKVFNAQIELRDCNYSEKVKKIGRKTSMEYEKY